MGSKDIQPRRGRAWRALVSAATIASVAVAIGCVHPAATPANDLAPTEAGGGATRTASLAGRAFRGLIQPAAQETMTGLVTMKPGQQMGTTVVTLNVLGAAPGKYNWHIHVGPCGTDDSVVLGSKSEYPELQVLSGGEGSARTVLGTVPPPSGGNYHVVIHEIGGTEETTYACGNLNAVGV